MNVTPYLYFKGNCEAALGFYESCGLGRVTELKRFAGTAMADRDGPAWHDKVLHSVFEGPGLRLCASDGKDSEAMKGCALFIELDDPSAAVALFVALACVIGVVVDLARAGVARATGLASIRGSRPSGWTMMLRGLRAAFSVIRHSFRAAVLGWAWRAVLSLGLIGVGYIVAQAVGGTGGSVLLVLWLVHQGIVMARVALRASWLARAVALVAPVEDARATQRAEQG